MLTMLINVLTAPIKAFADLKEKPTFLFPLLLVVVVSVVAQFIIFNLIDFDYLIEGMIQQALDRPNAPPESEIRQGLSRLTPNFLLIPGVVAAAIGPPIIYALYSLYLWMIGKLGSEELEYRQFFSITCWSAIPNLIATIAAILMVVLSSTRQFTQTELNPLTLNNLLFGLADGLPQTLSNLSITTFWALGLMTVGYRALTGSGWGKSALVVLLPPVLILGGITALTL